MRIYFQVPYRDPEMDDPDTRARQAIKHVPQKLTAYQEPTTLGLSFTPKLPHKKSLG